MEVFLTIVADTFNITNRGLVIAPNFPLSEYKFDKEERVRIETPDGNHFQCDSYFQVPLQTPPTKVISACCTLLKVSKEQVPIGSKIFIMGKCKNEISA